MVPRENPETAPSGASERVVQAIADAKDISPIELSPLCETVDPDALDTLVQGQTFESLAFTYEGYSVTIEPAGGVTVQNTPS